MLSFDLGCVNHKVFFVFLCLQSCLFTQSLQEIKTPKTPTIQAPTPPTPPIQDNEQDTQIFLQITQDILQNKMLLHSVCLPNGISINNNLTLQESKRLGISHYLSPLQYQDNLWRIRNLALEKIQPNANKDSNELLAFAQKILNKNEVSGVFMILEFSMQNIQKHVLYFAQDFIQIDGVFYHNTTQISTIFRQYFCHPHIFMQ